MNYTKHFINNYRILKGRMIEKNKGFWKVQSIHKLKLKLSSRFNTKDYLILKTIDHSSKSTPPFITFTSDNRYSNLNKKRLIKIKDKLPYKYNKNFFITNENLKREEEPKIKNKKRQIYVSFYKNFSYEPFLYNELPFIYMKGKYKTFPRKFNEVLKDSIIMKQYNEFLKDINYNTFSSNSTIKNNYDERFERNNYKLSNTKLTDSNLDNNFEISSLFSKKKKNDINFFDNNNNKHNLKIKTFKTFNDTNYSSTAYDGFFKRKKTEGVHTLPSLDI